MKRSKICDFLFLFHASRNAFCVLVKRGEFYKSLFVDCQKLLRLLFSSTSVSASLIRILKILFFTSFRDFLSCTKLSSSSSH